MTVLPLEYTSDKALSYYNRLRAALSSDRDKLALDLLFQSGCTVNELVQIKVSHIEFRKNDIRIPAENTKNKTERIVSLPVSLIRRVKSLAANKEADDYLDDMALGANFATVNQLLINSLVLEAFQEVIPGVQGKLVYFISHPLALCFYSKAKKD